MAAEASRMGKQKKARRQQKLQQQKQRAGDRRQQAELAAEPEPEPLSDSDRQTEVARRRVVLGARVSAMLTDAQILQIADPGPELHSEAAQRANVCKLRRFGLDPAEPKARPQEVVAPRRASQTSGSGGWTASEQAEIVRRRRVIGAEASAMLSDEQMLQIADPGPEPVNPSEQAAIAARLRDLGAALAAQRPTTSTQASDSGADEGEGDAAALRGLTLRQLLARAEQLGVDEQALNDAEEKSDLIALIVAKEAEARAAEARTEAKPQAVNIEAVWAAISAVDAAAVRSLLTANASSASNPAFNVNARGVDGETLLMHAAQQSNVLRVIRDAETGRQLKESMCDIVRSLIEHNADVNTTDLTGRTAFHLAIFNNCEDMGCILLGAGAKPGKCRHSFDNAHDSRCPMCVMHGKRLQNDMDARAGGQRSASKETFEAVLRDEFGDEPGDSFFLKELELAKLELGQGSWGDSSKAARGTDRVAGLDRMD